MGQDKTTIAITHDLKDTLKDEENDGEDYEDVIENLLILKGKCPKCGKEGNVLICDSYLFEPLYFDVTCTNCEYEKEKWRIPLGTVNEKNDT